jgi:hypothetical protein
MKSCSSSLLLSIGFSFLHNLSAWHKHTYFTFNILLKLLRGPSKFGFFPMNLTPELANFFLRGQLAKIIAASGLTNHTIMQVALFLLT